MGPVDRGFDRSLPVQCRTVLLCVFPSLAFCRRHRPLPTLLSPVDKSTVLANLNKFTPVDIFLYVDLYQSSAKVFCFMFRFEGIAQISPIYKLV